MYFFMEATKSFKNRNANWDMFSIVQVYIKYAFRWNKIH